MIPMVDLRQQYEDLQREFDAAVQDVLRSTRYILGPNVQALEQETADYLGVHAAIGCASGTDALHLALDALGVRAGDEVITTPFTFIATAEAIRYLGAKPIFVDILPDSFNIDPEQVEAAITERTRAILPVHLFGQPADMTALGDIAERHGLLLVEDCAQSFGATLDGRQTGAIGAAGCFSFFPSKNLGCFGDGGLVTTQSEEVAESLRVLRNHGSRQRYHHSVIGYNSRLDEMQAAILRVKLPHIDRFNDNRRRVAHLYNELLAETGVTTPIEDGKGRHVYHQYTLLSERRQTIAKALDAAGIGNAIYYPIPLHRQEVFAQAYAGTELPVSEAVAQQCLSLPIFPELDAERIELIAATIRDALA